MSGTEKDIWCDDGRPMCRHGGRSHSLNVLCPDDEPTPDRHPKWQRVEPGHVIPAGQPYRVEYGEYGTPAWNSHEFSSLNDFPRPGLGDDAGKVFVDSTWKPPLVLPTEPTWGIVRYRESFDDRVFVSIPRRFSMEEGRLYGEGAHVPASRMYDPANVLDFIPLTDEQVARIEAAR